jgi:aryl-alcohol dehydrogenase-like predicted oxidoreductase
MRLIDVRGLEKSCSQLVLGTVTLSPANLDNAFTLLDAYVENGGNTLDSAHVYGRGNSELTVGMWLQSRNNRKDVIVITKGAHHDANGPRVTPEAITKDLNESLERLQTDYIDIYMLHRDDPKVPVSEIMGILQEHRQSGKIRSFGASNWTSKRIDEANEYALSKGYDGFVVNSPNLSLAKPVEPRWAGCISVDFDYMDWHNRNQMPLFSWSSQAGGFFTGRYAPEITDSPEMVRTYYCEANWERYRRAKELAAQKGPGVNANHIALAYVLNQPFPTCALIGPEKLEELTDSLIAKNIELSPQEIEWIELRG